MVALQLSEIQQESFYSFLCRSLKSSLFEVYQLAGDASNRRYYRVVHLDQSHVLMVWEPFEENEKYPFLSVLRHFDRNNIRVPKIIDLSPSEGLVLLEDLGDLTLERRFWESQSFEHALPFYEQAIDELVKIHYAATQDKVHDTTAFHIEFNTEKLMWELQYAKKHLLQSFCEFSISKTIEDELDREFLAICTVLDQQPKFIAHRDYHSRNLMIKLGKVCVIDFQDARLGAIQYDLVSLLKDSYVDLKAEDAEKLLNRYFEGRKEMKQSSVSLEQFQEIYEIQSFQRCFKACGSFSSFFNTRQDLRYLKYLPQTIERVHASLLSLPQLSRLEGLLSDLGLFKHSWTDRMESIVK